MISLCQCARTCLGILLMATLESCKPVNRGLATADPVRSSAPGSSATVAGSGTNATATNPPPVFHLPKAQPKLPIVKLWLGAVELEAEVCITVPQVATGLMFREEIGPNEGMLFVFGEPRRREFYMKNVKFPIALAYINPDGTINEITTLKAMDESPVPSKSHAIQFVLETATDWFSRNNVGPGTLIRTDRGSLKDTLASHAQLR
jgi:uncharacterized membrane protein (UPF0127 family)